MVALAGILLVGLLLSTWFRTVEPSALDHDSLRTIQDFVPTWLTDLSARIDVLGSLSVVASFRVATVVVLAVYRRWRQLVVLLVALVVTDWVVVRLLGVDRPQPVGVEPMTDRATFWFPSRPTAALAVTVIGLAITLFPAGRPRRWAIWGAVVVSIGYAGARIVLGADHVLDAGYAVILGVALPYALFRATVPDDVFPVTYARKRGSAHLDLGGERGRAIVRAMADQLGFTVTEVEAFGLEGSGGSSPLRLSVYGAPGHFFAKIYSTSHLRADRWYRFGRTLLYGQLEDEVPFASVRRLAEYEDYALRILDDVQIWAPRTYGIAELTPNREYMVVMEFLDDARTLDVAAVDDTVIDDGMGLVEAMWERGLAHRDLKPANMVVRRGHLQLVDVSGLEIRPTRWRQLVDLANMMLVLALRSDPRRVIERAKASFTEEDIADALAADVGLAIPTQLQAQLRVDPRPILATLKELVPERPPISIQRWSVRRVALLVGTALAMLILAGMFVDTLMAGLR